MSLREAMGNLLEESIVPPRGGGQQAAAPAGLAVDIRETPEAFMVTASVPGVKPEDVDITVLGDTLRIRGQQRDEAENQSASGRWIIRERRLGTFERTVRLPTTIRSGDAEAEFKDGVLTVRLPKTEEAKPRSIPVRPSQQGAGQAR
jgi:HSP20 family protein